MGAFLKGDEEDAIGSKGQKYFPKKGGKNTKAKMYAKSGVSPVKFAKGGVARVKYANAGMQKKGGKLQQGPQSLQTIQKKSKSVDVPLQRPFQSKKKKSVKKIRKRQNVRQTKDAPADVQDKLQQIQNVNLKHYEAFSVQGLAEMRTLVSFQKPPEDIRLLVMAANILTGGKPRSWGDAKGMMPQLQKKLLNLYRKATPAVSRSMLDRCDGVLQNLSSFQSEKKRFGSALYNFLKSFVAKERLGYAQQAHRTRLGVVHAELFERSAFVRAPVSLSPSQLDLIMPDDIKLEEQIGEGFFGVVWKGRYKLHTPCAIKRLKRGISTEAASNAFMKELKMLKSMRHLNIVMLYGSTPPNPNPSIVTELLYKSLAECLHGITHPGQVASARGGMSDSLKIRIMKDAA